MWITYVPSFGSTPAGTTQSDSPLALGLAAGLLDEVLDLTKATPTKLGVLKSFCLMAFLQNHAI